MKCLQSTKYLRLTKRPPQNAFSRRSASSRHSGFGRQSASARRRASTRRPASQQDPSSQRITLFRIRGRRIIINAEPDAEWRYVVFVSLMLRYSNSKERTSPVGWNVKGKSAHPILLRYVEAPGVPTVHSPTCLSIESVWLGGCPWNLTTCTISEPSMNGAYLSSPRPSPGTRHVSGKPLRHVVYVTPSAFPTWLQLPTISDNSAASGNWIQSTSASRLSAPALDLHLLHGAD